MATALPDTRPAAAAPGAPAGGIGDPRIGLIAGGAAASFPPGGGLPRFLFPDGFRGLVPLRARHPHSRPVVVAAALALTLSACQRDEVSHYRVAKETPAPARAAPAGMGSDVPAPPRPGGGAALTWTLPRSWTETRGGDSMRFATLRPPVEGRVDVSVVVLPGTAGGELANVNRWRGQIGLPPLDDAALAGARHGVATKAGEVSLYDFTSEGQSRTRVVAVLATLGGNSWFVKMTGDERVVTAARPDFIRLVESLRLAEAD